MRIIVRSRKFVKSLFLVPYYRLAIVRIRLFYYIYIARKLRFFKSDFAFETTISHNIKGLKYCNNRIELLIKPLSVVELLNQDSEVLIIGPRNEHDLYCLVAHGFRKNRVRGLDLISYSPWIDLGDMHSTPYSDNRFDAVIIGWTLSYSRDPKKLAKEIRRIIKDGGIVAIGVEYSTMTEADEVELMGYAIQEFDLLNKRVNCVDDILELFSPNVNEVFFRHDAPQKRSHTKSGLIENVSNVAVIFSVNKVTK